MKNVYPMLQSISRKIYNNFRDEFVDLAMDYEDVVQESYLYYLDFEKRFKQKFPEKIIWSAIKQYVIWKIMEKVYNFRDKGVELISIENELGICNDSQIDIERFLHEKLLSAKEINSNRASPLKNDEVLKKILLKTNPKFNFKKIKEILGEKKYNIFLSVLLKDDDDTFKSIGEKYEVSKQYVDKVYRKSLKKIRLAYKHKNTIKK
jgi:hypothetical protein